MLERSVSAPVSEFSAIRTGPSRYHQLREKTGLDPIRSRRRKQQETHCGFCKNNGEDPEVYQSHVLKIHGQICCPVLYNYVCPRCGATEENAHTLRHCPYDEKNLQKQLELNRQLKEISSGRAAAAAATADTAGGMGENKAANDGGDDDDWPGLAVLEPYIENRPVFEDNLKKILMLRLYYSLMQDDDDTIP